VRLSTFLFLVLGVASLGGTGWFLWHVTAGRREWNEMRSYSGRDLQGQDERVLSLATKLLQEGHVLPVNLRWIAGLDGPGGREALLFGELLPSDRVRLTLFDDQRRMIFVVNVRVQRWHESIQGVRGNTRPDLAPWTFALVMDGAGAEGIGLEHYAVLEDRPALIRLERPSGESVPNMYRDADQIGPEPPLRTPEAWERRLFSENLAEILEVLLWLGGIHAEPVMGRAGYPTESPHQIEMFQETARRPGVRARLRELARHPHPWIAHAAEQARGRLER